VEVVGILVGLVMLWMMVESTPVGPLGVSGWLPLVLTIWVSPWLRICSVGDGF
jgi:hypothetical protein